MILTITPNPAVDRTAFVERLEWDQILRPSQLTVLPGGKGNNVARAASTLGASVTTTGLIGGHAGRWIIQELRREGLQTQFAESTSETRTTYVMADAEGRTVILYEHGADVAGRDVRSLLAMLRGTLVPASRFVVAAGSLPQGAPHEVFADIVEICRLQHRPCLVDTSGPPLLLAIEAGADIIKISLDEAADSGLGTKAIDVVTEVVQRGAKACVVTKAAEGATGFDGTNLWKIDAPSVEVVSQVGSGDAFTAGLVVGLAQGMSWEAALRCAAAAGAANVLTLGAGHFALADYDSLAEKVRVTLAQGDQDP